MAKTRHQMTKKLLATVAILVILMGFFLQEAIDRYSFFIGLSISFINSLLFISVLFFEKRRISKYLAQSLVRAINLSIMRFALAIFLLTIAFRRENTDAKSLLVGFIFGLILLVCYQLNRLAKQHGNN